MHMPFRCNYYHDTGHLRNNCHHLRTSLPIKSGFNFIPVPDLPRLETCPLSVDPLEDSTDIIYASSSPSTFDDLSKGQLMYIKDVEAIALHSRVEPVEILVSSALDSSSKQVDAIGPPRFTLDHYPSLPQITYGLSSSTSPSSPTGC